MTTLFLLLSAFIGWTTYNLFRPVIHHPQFGVVSFLAGWLVGELAIHHIVWQVALVALFVLFGGVDGLFGALGFIVCVSAWLAMAYYYLKSDSARWEVELALEEGLGRDYEDSVREEFSSRFPGEPDFNRITKPFGQLPPEIEVVKDLPFGTHDLCLDIYRPRGSVKDAPVLLQIHGGAWTENMGSKNEQAIPLMAHMAQRNWVCVAISYRLSPGATFPEHIIDCKEALVWVKDHIVEYGGNPDFVITTGGSAGGHLCALLALSANDPQFQPGFESSDTTVQGAVPFYGPFDFTDSNKHQKHTMLEETLETSVMKLSHTGHESEYQQASPLFRIHQDAPPFLVIQGDKDSLVPVEEGRHFSDRLKEVSNSAVVYAEIAGAQHAFDMFPSVRSEHVKHGVEKFLAWTYSHYLAETADAGDETSSAGAASPEFEDNISGTSD